MTTNRDTQSSSEFSEQSDQLWISDEFYIPINEKGRCNGICYEGALGYIIQVISKDKQRYYALKIPKLTGDTLRENMYINYLMEKELTTVKKIYGGLNSKSQGLLAVTNIDQAWIRKPLKIETNEEFKDWNGAYIFVKYEKGKNPEFCLVKKKGEEEKVEIFPPNYECPIKDNNLAEEFFDKFEKLENKFEDIIFIDFSITDDKLQKQKVELFSVKEIKDPDKTLWCICVPSVVYQWIPGTLQEAISCKKREVWKIRTHFDLIEKLCLGLSSMHWNGMLHGDLRPANVIYESDPNDPTNYQISDYGSLAEYRNFAEEGNATSTEETIIGPVVMGERSSAFYAPERKLGKEREAADIAVIKNDNQNDDVYIILGWKNDLIDPNTNQIDTQKVDEYIQQVSNNQEQKKTHQVDTQNVDKSRQQVSNNQQQQKTHQVDPQNVDKSRQQVSNNKGQQTLKSGDRIQVNDYIFELIDKEIRYQEKQILKCSTKIGKIYQNRIPILTNVTDEFQNSENKYYQIQISRTRELLQWSAATDLYSLGAIGLYSVYTNYQSSELSHSNKEVNNNPQEIIDLDKSFEEMLSYLASVPYCNLIWPELESLRKNLEEYLDNKKAHNLSINSFSKKPYIYAPKIKIDNSSRSMSSAIDLTSDDSHEKENLEKAIKRISALVIQTVPEVDKLLKVMDFDLGPFIFFIHFVLCCLHREDDLDKQDWMEELPFSKNRWENPQLMDDNNASQKAFKRISKLQRLIEDEYLSVFKEEESNLPKFNPKSDTIIRVELEKMGKEKGQVNQELKKLDSEYQTLQEKHTKLEEDYNYLEEKKMEASKLFCKHYLFKKHDLIGWLRLIQISIWDYQSIKGQIRKKISEK